MSLEFLAQFGEDALQNHFEIIIPPFVGVGDIANLNLRVLTVDIPDQAIDVYTITKSGQKLTRPNGITAMANEWTFTFRVDKAFQAYKSLSRWMNYVQDTKTGAMASDSGPLGIYGPSQYRVPISVVPLDPSRGPTDTGWLIENNYPSNLSGISFNEESGDPLIASCTMQCGVVNYL